MDEKSLKDALHGLPVSGLRFYPQAASTNDLALAWAAEDARDFSLVITETQTAGRGRAGRSWHSAPGSSLTFSLILRPDKDEAEAVSLFSGLGALSLAETLEQAFGLRAQIKWPNDVLFQGQKLAGILVETVWLGENIESIVLGMGINIRSAAVPPPEKLDFPATSLEHILTTHPARLPLLRDVLTAMLAWRPRLKSREFLSAWEARLAYRGEQVQVWVGTEAPQSGVLLGLAEDGSLRLRPAQGQPILIRFGDVHLRPAV